MKEYYLATCSTVATFVAARWQEYAEDWTTNRLSLSLPISLLSHFTKFGNDPSSFLASTLYQSFLPSPTPSPPSLAATPRFDPFSRNPGFDDLVEPHAFVTLGPVVSPRICPPDRCSGRPPIVENYEKVESLVVEIFGRSLSLAVIEQFPIIEVKMKLALASAISLGTLDLGTEAQREAARNFLPRVFNDYLHREDQRSRSTAGILLSQIPLFSMLLVSAFPSSVGLRSFPFQTAVNEMQAPCLCDLTHIVLPLETLAKRCEGGLERLIGAEPDTHAPLASLAFINGSVFTAPNLHRHPAFSKPGWRPKLPKFLEFLSAPMDELLRPHSVQLVCFTESRSLALLLGATGLLELVWAADAGEDLLKQSPEAQLAVVDGCVEFIVVDTEFQADIEVLERKVRSHFPFSMNYH